MSKHTYITLSVSVNGIETTTTRERRGAKYAASILEHLKDSGAVVTTDNTTVTTTTAKLTQGGIALEYTFKDADASDKFNDLLAASDHPITENFKPDNK
ncbi:hypothetical protein [Lacticaseibacillus rhamnosus]|uniref:hypothetical protein n=1 Tax=Lacticaseibacillus rhamnosus TaxID=47715 RepID=UPI00237F8FF4|nr:hypothetical protein [Lacticaseibacillus rhamnosus]MDE3295894.1 hypothetical protein [Lacticaseibacillus rhamnosus]